MASEGGGVAGHPDAVDMTVAAGAAPLIRCSGLTKHYDGVVALDALSLEVEQGAVGLVGANGAGKTTLMRLLMGLSPPSAGTVEVLGVDVGHDPIEVRDRIGYMPEHDCLPDDQSAADLVATMGELSGLPAGAARQRASHVLDLVGLDEARFRPIDGYSTGMRQRTKLAQALVADPALVLLDEPTAGLDPMGREEMLDLVVRLSGFGISVLFSTHLLEDVERTCDQVVMLDAGRLVQVGHTETLVGAGGVVVLETTDPLEPVIAALAARSLDARPAGPGRLELDGRVEDVAAAVCAVLDEQQRPLLRLTTRRGSLDDAFVAQAGR